MSQHIDGGIYLAGISFGIVDPHVIDILNSELLKIIFNIIRHHINQLKTLYYYEGKYFPTN